MAKKFQLSSESRFTLLSGIAHDPVQSGYTSERALSFPVTTRHHALQGKQKHFLALQTSSLALIYFPNTNADSKLHLGDIFTPLFLGAQLLVPSREDISHEKLAEWMREHKPTVTHLTPAMGQILVSSFLSVFFFFWWVLEKMLQKTSRDASKFLRDTLTLKYA